MKTPPTETMVQDNPIRSRGNTSAPPSAIVTREGERALRAELEGVRSELEGGMIERLREARTFGAPADNDDYLQIQEEEMILAVRAARLTEVLDRVEVVDAGTLDGKAAVGTVVEVRDIESGALGKHELVGGHEPPRSNTASAASPIGQALLGQSAGTVVAVHLPTGVNRSVEILRVRSAGRRSR